MRRLALILIGLLLVPALARADYYDGLQAMVAGDHGTAYQEWLIAAQGGHVESQYQLAIMYEEGVGVPQNYIEAHRWYNVAAAQGHETARTARDALAARMTPEDLSAAQKLAAAWAPDPTAARRQRSAEPETGPAVEQEWERPPARRRSVFGDMEPDLPRQTYDLFR
jgi:TPR repeat protein